MTEEQVINRLCMVIENVQKDNHEYVKYNVAVKGNYFIIEPNEIRVSYFGMTTVISLVNACITEDDDRIIFCDHKTALWVTFPKWWLSMVV